MTVLLSASGLTCRFGKLVALDPVDLALAAGERHAVIGPNGAGKTTLLGAIAGTIRPHGGTVLLDGRNITTASPARRARLGVARTFQTPALADSLTVLDNLRIGAWRHSLARARVWRGHGSARTGVIASRALHQLDALGLAHLAGTPAGQLSHGRRRLLEIGMALAARPRLLLLDEPAAGLTDVDLPRLLHCLHRLPGSVAVLLVEHHLDLVTAVADTVTVLHQGRVLAHGSPAEIHAHPGVAEVYPGAEQPAVT